MNPRRYRQARQLLAPLIVRTLLPALFVVVIPFSFLLGPRLTSTLAAIPREQTQASAPQSEPKAVVLDPGKSLDRELSGGEKHTYEIHADAGQFLHAQVEQLGIHAALTLYSPDGKPIATMDSPNGRFGLQQISAIAETTGAFTLQVSSGYKNVPAARYRISLSPARPPTDQDRARISAERLFVEAVRLDSRGNPDSSRSAIEKYASVLPLWHTAGDAYEEALTLQSLGSLYLSLDQRQKALDFFLQALPLAQAQPVRSLAAGILNSLGLFYSNAGEMQKALGYFNQVLPLVRSVGDRSLEAAVLDNLAGVYSALGEKQKALDHFHESLLLRRAVHDRLGEAITLNNLGQLYSSLNEYQTALDYYHQVLPLVRALGSRDGEAATLNNIGAVYKNLGDAQKALDYYNQSLPPRRAAGDRAGEAATLSNIGDVYVALGDFQSALRFYLLSLPLARETGNRAGEAITLNNVGGLYEDLGQPRKALDYLMQALPIRRSIGDRDGEAATLNNLGRLYSDLDDQQKALDYFMQAIALDRAVGNRNQEATTLNNAGRLYLDLGQKDKALDFLSQALQLHRDVGDRLGEAVTLTNTGRLLQQLGQMPDALDHYNQALALFRAVQDPLDQAEVLTTLMQAWSIQHQPETAIFLGKQAVNQIQLLRNNMRTLDKETQHSFLNTQAGTYRELADILISQARLPEAQQVLELLKNEEYFEFIRRDGRDAASLTAPVALTKKEEELSHKYDDNAASVTAIANERSALLAKSSRTPDEEKHLADLAAQLKLANQAWSKFLDDLHTELAKSAQPQITVSALQENASALQKVVRQLGPGTVALYTLVGEEKFHIILVTPTVQLAREFPIKAAELNKKIAAFREALLDPKSDPIPQAQELYKIIVGPVAKDLDGAQATTLMWSLDGVLRYIPLAALHDGHAYLLEKYRNIVFTPASIPELAAPPAVAQWRGLAMGVSKSYGGMSTLPAVPAELRAIIRETGTAESAGVIAGHTMLDDNFTEDNLKQALAQNYPLIHIASHFVFGPGDDTDSYLLLGGKQSQGQRLTLAEINDDPDISFNDVELLTLSACNTALTIPGDGREVDGLGILAQRKGAKAVLATLWSVYDPSTSALMQTFYRNWTTPPVSSPGTSAAAPLSKAEALRRAQLSLLHASPEQSAAGAKPPYAHPYYWAPFILIGNWQ